MEKNKDAAVAASDVIGIPSSFASTVKEVDLPAALAAFSTDLAAYNLMEGVSFARLVLTTTPTTCNSAISNCKVIISTEIGASADALAIMDAGTQPAKRFFKKTGNPRFVQERSATEESQYHLQ